MPPPTPLAPSSQSQSSLPPPPMSSSGTSVAGPPPPPSPRRTPLGTTEAEAARCPYKAWNVYLPEERYGERPGTLEKVRCAQRFLEARFPPGSRKRDAIVDKRSFTLSARELLGDEGLSGSWASLKEELSSGGAEAAFGMLGLAMHQSLVEDLGLNPGGERIPLVRARILEVGAQARIGALRTRDIGSLVSVKVQYFLAGYWRTLYAG